MTLVECLHFILAGCCNVISEVDASNRFQKECLSKLYIVHSWVHVHLLYTLSMHTNITHKANIELITVEFLLKFNYISLMDGSTCCHFVYIGYFLYLYLYCSCLFVAM